MQVVCRAFQSAFIEDKRLAGSNPRTACPSVIGVLDKMSIASCARIRLFVRMSRERQPSLVFASKDVLQPRGINALQVEMLLQSGFGSLLKEAIMKARYLITAVIVVLLLFVSVSAARADTLKLKDGSKVEGVIKKMEAGKVFLTVKGESKVLNVSDVAVIDFTAATDVKNTEAEEVVANLKELDKAATEIRQLLNQIELYWSEREPIDAKMEPAWNVAKETFRQPLARYQEVLNDLYFHVLARVDEYNALAKDASKVYVGVKGIRVGSALISSELDRLPLKKYVPGTWYDTIFYDGYNLGYFDATEKVAR